MITCSSIPLLITPKHVSCPPHPRARLTIRLIVRTLRSSTTWLHLQLGFLLRGWQSVWMLQFLHRRWRHLHLLLSQALHSAAPVTPTTNNPSTTFLLTPYTILLTKTPNKITTETPFRINLSLGRTISPSHAARSDKWGPHFRKIHPNAQPHPRPPTHSFSSVLHHQVHYLPLLEYITPPCHILRSTLRSRLTRQHFTPNVDSSGLSPLRIARLY